MDRLLLGQLGANGDCLYATILARQLRKDYPKAHITWALSTQCLDVARNNPDIDEVWHVPVSGWDRHEQMWGVFEREAFRRYKQGDFDRILLSQIWPNNFQNYDGTVRPSILRAYGRPITVPIENVIRLTDEEIARTEAFVHDRGLMQFAHRILFECSSKSGQSFVTPDLAQDIADQVYARLPDATVIFSTNLPMALRDPRSRYAGELSLRESAHLTHACTLFIGCGSGGTVAATSTAAMALPTLQLLAASTSMLASFAHDFEYFGLHDRQFIEMTQEDPTLIAECVARICLRGAKTAHDEFDSGIKVSFDYYRGVMGVTLMKQNRFLDAARSLRFTAERYGWTRDLVAFGRDEIAPRLPLDPSWLFAAARTRGEEFLDVLAEAATHPVDAPRQRPLKGAA